MPNGLLSIINTKLLKATACAEQIKKNATQHRAGLGTYEDARVIAELLDDVMKNDLQAWRAEIEQNS